MHKVRMPGRRLSLEEDSIRLWSFVEQAQRTPGMNLNPHIYLSGIHSGPNTTLNQGNLSTLPKPEPPSSASSLFDTTLDLLNANVGAKHPDINSAWWQALSATAQTPLPTSSTLAKGTQKLMAPVTLPVATLPSSFRPQPLTLPQSNADSTDLTLRNNSLAMSVHRHLTPTFSNIIPSTTSVTSAQQQWQHLTQQAQKWPVENASNTPPINPLLFSIDPTTSFLQSVSHSHSVQSPEGNNLTSMSCFEALKVPQFSQLVQAQSPSATDLTASLPSLQGLVSPPRNGLLSVDEAASQRSCDAPQFSALRQEATQEKGLFSFLSALQPPIASTFQARGKQPEERCDNGSVLNAETVSGTGIVVTVVPNKGHCKSQTLRLDLNSLNFFFGVPLKDAASAIGVSPTALKKACRLMGMKKWPYNKFEAPRELLAKINSASSSDEPARGAS